ncbi:MAG: glycosyltransferase [Parcubacteria group bacterium]
MSTSASFTKPLVSILLPTKNAGEIFEHVLRGIEQQHQVDFEVIICDSGSKDGTLERIAKFAERVPFKVQLIQIPAAEYGHGKTRNLMAGQARGEIIVLLTHDASPTNAHWLVAITKPFANPKVGLVFGPQRPRPDANPVMRADLLNFFAGFAVAGRTTLYATNPAPGVDRVGPVSDGLMRFSSDANAAVRRSAWQKCPFRDVAYCEDQLMARDLLESGWYKVYEPRASVYHSHNFGIIESFKRYNDEWLGLKRAFGHVEVRHVWQLPLRIARASQQNQRALLADPRLSLWQKIFWSPRVVALAKARQLGGYLGPRMERLPHWLQKRISREAHLIKA